MKKSLFATLIMAAACVNAADYQIDSHHANARFAIDHFGTSTNTGGFYNLSGSLKFDPQAKTGSVDISIPVASLNSGNAAFDKHLKSADLFNVAQFPEMRFQSTRWHFNADKVSAVEGNLTLLGKTAPVTLKATKFNCYQSPMKKAQVCGGDFEAAIDRTQWGMNYLVDAGVTKQVNLHIQVEAVKQ